MARPPRSRYALAAAFVPALFAAACSSTPSTTATGSTGGSTSAPTSAPTTAPSSSTSPTTAPGSTSSTSSTSTSSGGSGASSVPEPPGGGRVYSDPADKITAEIGDEFVVSLPAPTKASTWVWADNCVNVKLLDSKVDSKDRTLFRFQFTVAGGCYLDFYDAETADTSATPDRRFDVSEPDL